MFYVSRTHQKLHQTPNSYGRSIYCQLNRTKRRKDAIKPKGSTENRKGNEPKATQKKNTEQKTKMPNIKEANIQNSELLKT